MKRGAVLFEVLLSIAIFAGAAMFTLGAVRQGINDLERRIRTARALDLARTAIAQLEAGLIDLADLREGDPDVLMESSKAFDESFEYVRWTIEAETQRTEYEGLTLLTITVRQEQGEEFGPTRSDDDEDVASVTLRQLVRLEPIEASPFEDDELVADLIDADPEEDTR
ncbi:MAG: hypothetical protein O7G85_06705 [Planctomycetota bacterium]|nr:hypothetical protein [Planctomycetota bacterium]